jgi:6-phosphogluconolactonase/glucosamine-6-phosphate isomerase/deaminase
MQLVELETSHGKKVWVNPEKVITLTVSTTNNAATDLHLVEGLGKAVTIKGTLADVAKVLNGALKA